jgi:long-chain fatty acid transport protein
MFENKKLLVVSWVIFIFGLSPAVSNATNGLFQPGYGARQLGIAGSGIAFPQDAMISAINPAGVVFAGKHRDIGITLFSPSREYTVSGNSPPPPSGFPPYAGPTVESESTLFIIPDLSFSWQPHGDTSAIGLAIYGNGGMNTDWLASDTPFGVGTFAAAAVPGADTRTGVDYAQLFVNLSYSRKFSNDSASWGVSAIGNASRLRMRGLAGFSPFSLDPANLTDNGHDVAYGIGARLGIQARVSDSVSIGASYQTKISNEYDDYAGLFPNGGELDIPATAQVGLAIETGPGTFTGDIQYIEYSGSDAIGNTSTTLTTGCVPSAPFTPFPTASGASCMGGNMGFGWEDMTVFKFGYTWDTSSSMTWRVGASFGDQPVQEQDVTINIIAPGVMEEHFTFGFSKKLESEKEFNFAFLYAPEQCVSGPDLFTPGKSVELCMEQISATFGLSF